MVLPAAVTLALLAAQPGASEVSVGSAPRAAQLLAQAPVAGASLHDVTQRALRARELATYRRALEAQLHSTRAGTSFIAVGSAAMGVAVAWGVYTWAYVGFNTPRWSEIAVLASAGASLVSGVVMLILGVVMQGQINRHNAAVDQRINEVDAELEQLRPVAPEAAPPPQEYPPGAPVPMI